MEYSYRNAVDGFRVNYTLLVPENNAVLHSSEEQAFLKELDDAYSDIARLTNKSDGYDYALAVSSGIVAGLIDSFFVGEWNYNNAKKKSNIAINNIVLEFAKKDPRYIPWCNNGKGKSNRWTVRDPDRLASAVEFLEIHYRLPGDNDWKIKGSGISASSHHLDDFCHHPTLIGMICSILVQFSGRIQYCSAAGTMISLSVSVNEYGEFVSDKTYGKIFAGIINWFFNAAKTIKNHRGHIMSDMAGSKSAVGKRTAGAGIPGTVMSVLKELSALPCLKDTAFPENLRKAYQNGIGETGGKLDLGVLNNLFEGAGSKFDMRTEKAVKYELKRQAVPVTINEIVVRAFYFVRSFISQMKGKHSLMDVDWKKMLPINNRTIQRMLMISSGVLCVVDLCDATIRAEIKSKGNGPVFGSVFLLRVNFVGIGRFTVVGIGRAHV